MYFDTIYLTTTERDYEAVAKAAYTLGFRQIGGGFYKDRTLEDAGLFEKTERDLAVAAHLRGLLGDLNISMTLMELEALQHHFDFEALKTTTANGFRMAAWGESPVPTIFLPIRQNHCRAAPGVRANGRFDSFVGFVGVMVGTRQSVARTEGWRKCWRTPRDSSAGLRRGGTN
jgi:hypothetical protein